jgi:transcriptional regulator of acetoin/glycerol metabolism
VPAAPLPAKSTAAKRRAESKPPDRAELEALLRAHRGNVAELARAQGRSRKQVYRWLEALDLDASGYRRE